MYRYWIGRMQEFAHFALYPRHPHLTFVKHGVRPDGTRHSFDRTSGCVKCRRKFIDTGDPELNDYFDSFPDFCPLENPVRVQYLKRFFDD